MKKITTKWMDSEFGSGSNLSKIFKNHYPKGLSLEKMDRKTSKDFVFMHCDIDIIANKLLSDKKLKLYNWYISSHMDLGVQGSWNKMVSLYSEK